MPMAARVRPRPGPMALSLAVKFTAASIVSAHTASQVDDWMTQVIMRAGEQALHLRH
jgi:hypothetical protein